MKLLLLNCPECRHPLDPHSRDRVVACLHCEAHATLDQRGVHTTPVRYAQPAGPPNQVVAWEPMWLFRGKVTMQERRVASGRRQEAAAAAQMWQTPRNFYVPAGNLPLKTVRKIGIALLQSQPQFQLLVDRPDDIRMQPAITSAEDAKAMLDFLILGLEAERSDMLQKLSFQVDVNLPQLWALPSDGRRYITTSK